MSDHVLHQLVHGYDHGHSLLAGSVELAPRDSDLVARLSDLSGTLGPESEVAPYLSLYPLPSRRFFAVARSWPDNDAPRAGCVLTHTILVPLDLWTVDGRPDRFSTALRQPARESLRTFAESVQDAPAASEWVPSDEPLVPRFVRRYFGEGLTPVAWIGALTPEATCWRIVAALWPTLRAQFACCTMALQPRSLEERPFDLLFAPRSAFSRFSDFPRAHIVDSRTTADSLSAERWVDTWADCICGRSEPSTLDRVRHLATDLEGYPTAIRRVFLFLELEERARGSATAAVGALDVLDTLADYSDAQKVRRQLVLAALEQIAPLESDAALEVLYLLSQRLAALSIADQEHIENRIRIEVERTLTAPSRDGFRTIESLVSRQAGEIPRPFLLGVCNAMTTHTGDGGISPTLLLTSPGLGRQAVAAQPSLAAAVLNLARTDEHSRAVDVLCEWFRAEHRKEIRSLLLSAMIPVIASAADTPLLEELLRDVGSADVPVICQALEGGKAFADRRISDLVARLVGKQAAADVQAWATRNTWHTFQTAQLIAASFPPDHEGLLSLLNAASLSSTGRSWVLAGFLESVATYSVPSWLQVLLKDDPRIWECMLSGISEQRVAEVVTTICRSLRRSAIARVTNAEKTLAALPGLFGDAVHEHAVRQLLADFFEGHCDIGTLDRWLSVPRLTDTLTRGAPSPLAAAVREYASPDRNGWRLAWELVARIPPSVVRQNSTVVHAVVDILLSNPTNQWTRNESDCWQRILVGVSRGDSVRLDLCSQALRFAFEHKHLPLGAVVATTFYPVHEAAAAEKADKRSWFGWAFTQWDKAVDLRRGLVDAFLQSNWSPADFVVATRETWLLRKLCKRMLRQWGGYQFLERAYLSLSEDPSRGQGNAILSTLSTILGNPEVEEDWD